jgi:hypothetical protein
MRTPFIIKIHVHSTKSEVALKNLNSLCNVELILGLPYTLPLLDYVHIYVDKFAQGNMFV